MDEVSDESPWLPAILAIDFGHRLIQDGTLSLFLVCLIFSCYFLFGSWLDLALVSVAVGLKSVGSLASWIHDSASAHVSLASASALLAAWLIFNTVRSSFTSRDDIPWNGPEMPYLIPCRTMHSRQVPKKHSFSYSYLVVGTPVGYSGNVNGIVSVDVQEQARSRQPGARIPKGWFDVDAADCLQRGYGEVGLRGKLDGYLKSQDIDPSDYPHAYLITVPRFLGYHFNPVAFWYLYSSDKVLSAIVLDVNNTFDERRTYLVLRAFPRQADTASASNGAAQSRITASWPKDFHVSPFNSRKGTYSLLASDPLGPDMKGFHGLDVTINLASSAGHPKFFARLFSEGEAVDPSRMSAMQTLRFLLGWCWVGFATFPRIIRQAAALFLKHKLHVWYRPEPLKTTQGRHADRVEKDLEHVFRRYLRHLVQQSPKALSVRYLSSGIPSLDSEVFKSSAAADQPGAAEQFEIRILTPVFYSRFAQYAHDFEGIFSELTENGTVWVDKPHLLPGIFLKKASSPLQTSSLTDFAGFKAIQRLRRRPEKIPQAPTTSADPLRPTSRAIDIRDFRISSMDAYVLGQDDGSLIATYRAAVLRVLIADRFLMGQTGLVKTVEFLGHAGLAWTLVSLMMRKMR
ncbi:DNA-binding WRKY domain-containing protein [Hirsutella rhossiliensis]|uniref:DNA-binding WRKY domain-containing protein n=1 Tax=Hirsutella rhossiliensis TaxID=111463 RepID=A0A9P8SH86_9HYPO|nr:DNA-binding WRKY domain-containing protein [Hirsutella rhossiliensis]KAH0961909.1 DNA-binding WRKY domain-containing protein [Hirsutella rhossiliensis]